MEATRSGVGRFFDSRQRTEIVRLDAEDRVELAAKVFQRDHRRQFHQLLVGEMFLKTFEKFIRDPFARVGYRFGQLQRELLAPGKKSERAMPRQVAKKRSRSASTGSEPALSSSKGRTNEIENY